MGRGPNVKQTVLVQWIINVYIVFCRVADGSAISEPAVFIVE